MPRKFYYKFQSILTTFLYFHQEFALHPSAHLTQIKCNAYGTCFEVARQDVAFNGVQGAAADII